MSEHGEHGGPWYIHPWPWFIVILLGTTVVAGLATVYIAASGADALVVDDYHRQGKAINQQFEADRVAARFQAVARVLPGSPTILQLDILTEAPARLELDLRHVTDEDRDVRLDFELGPDERYTSAEPLPVGVFVATLRPIDGAPTWRLRNRLRLSSGEAIVMVPRP